MTTLVPKYSQGATGAVNRAINLKLAEAVSILDFGADPTGIADSSTAIQNAINTGKKLYFPKGTYLCNVIISDYFDWQGDGIINSVLKPFSTATPVVTNLYQEPDWRATSISDIGFESTGFAGVGFSYGNPTTYSTRQEYAGRVIFNRCSFKGFDKGILKPYGNIGNVYNQCYFQSNNYGSYAVDAKLATGGVSDQMQPDTDTWNGGEFHNNQIAAICCLAENIAVGQLVLNQTIIQVNPGFGIYLDFPGCNARALESFNNVWFEGNATAATVTIPVVSAGVITPTALAPSDLSITGIYGYTYWGSESSGYNGIGTYSPNATLGLWGNQRSSLNLISGGTAGSNFTSLQFSNVGTESTAGASIIARLPAGGTDKSLDFQTGSFIPFKLSTNGGVQIGSSAGIGGPPSTGATEIYAPTGLTAVGNLILTISAPFAAPHLFYVTDDATYNAASAGYKIGKVTSTGRSINAAGTVNANGADYAEYMTKSGAFNITKGDICGIDAKGKLTNVFADAISFVVKSTNPSYVGGDTWGVDLEGESLEVARQTVDRIAFAGQVPVNVIGATVGDYIVPVNTNGAIKGEAVSSPTLAQYISAVGKVISIENGITTIIVKVA